MRKKYLVILTDEEQTEKLRVVIEDEGVQFIIIWAQRPTVANPETASDNSP